MNGERGVLQQRVHALALHRRRPDAGEGIGGGYRKEKKPGGDRAEHADHPGAERARQVAPESGDGAAAKRQHQAPEEDRAVVVPPRPGDPVEERRLALAIGGHVADREVGGDVAPDKGGECRPDGDQLAERQARRSGHQPPLARLGADQRQHRLCGGEAAGEGESEVAELGDHGALSRLPGLPSGSSSYPTWRRAAARPCRDSRGRAS